MPDKPTDKPNFWSIVLSTLAAAVGIQSNKNRERDFQHHSIWPFIIAGILFTVLFVVALMLVVSWVVKA